MKERGKLSDIQVIALDTCCNDCEHWFLDQSKPMQNVEMGREMVGGGTDCEHWDDEETTSWW